MDWVHVIKLMCILLVSLHHNSINVSKPLIEAAIDQSINSMFVSSHENKSYLSKPMVLFHIPLNSVNASSALSFG